eukprot:43363_1
MALDWENIDHWDAGEIALLTVIAFLLALLFAMIACILYYGKIYYTLKKNEGLPLYKSDGGDGPYNQTARPHSYREDSSDVDDDEMDEENNINMANTTMRKSFHNGPLLQNHGPNDLVRYDTHTTCTAQSASTESDSQTTGSSTSDTNEDETLDTSNLKGTRRGDAVPDEDDDNTYEEDSDVMHRNSRNRLHIQHQAQLRGYDYIGPMSYQGQYGNDVMQQHHNKVVTHQPPPPPGAIQQTHLQHLYSNLTPSPHKTSHHHSARPSNSTMTSLTSVSATEPRHSNKHRSRGSNYHNKDYAYSPSDKESRRV